VIGGVAAAAGLGGVGAALWNNAHGGGDLPADFWSLRFDRPEGGELALAGLRGQPLLLNFWATWCAPCIRELPMLDRFQKEQRAGGWQVVGLAVDSPTPVREFLLKRPLTFSVGLAGLNGVELARALGNGEGALPFTVVFGRDGMPRARKLGALNEAELVRWKQELG
jgi:thiol-disulfide isomerase/thioredoxin